MQLLGYLFNWGLYGVVSVQVCASHILLYPLVLTSHSRLHNIDYYYIAFPNDRLYCKILVYGVFLLESLQTVVITHDAFASFGAGFGSFKALDDIQFTCLSIPILSGIGKFIQGLISSRLLIPLYGTVGCVVQMYYAYRIYILSRSKLIGYVIAVVSCESLYFPSQHLSNKSQQVSFIGCVAGIVTGVKSFELGSLSKLTQTTVFISAGVYPILSNCSPASCS